MKVLLISANISESPYPLYPLGMSVIAGALTNKGHSVAQCDYLQINKKFDRIKSKINSIRPEIIGISIRNIDNTNFANRKNYIVSSIELVRRIKQITCIPVVLGGAGYSLFPEEILEKTGADYGFAGESEDSFCKFIEDFSNGVLPEGKIITTKSENRNSIASALYSNSIINHYLQFGKTAPVQTKRGCANKCIYCTYPCLEGSTIRCRNPKDVVDDIIKLTSVFKTKMIFFTDSVFNDKDGNYIYLLEEMKRQNIRIPWTAFFQPGEFDSSVLSLMKETGLEYIELGADASTDTSLKQIGKNFSFSDVRKTVDSLNKYKIYSSVYYMFGGPGETEETVIEGITNIKSIKKAVSLIFMGIRILPGTPLEKLAIRQGVLKKGENLFAEKYYLSSKIDKNWLDECLKSAFKGIRTCIYPPDSLENKLKLLHSIGCVGMGLDKLL
jgi:radical SAM superfamily enzyme YgiQ (UPF0313 family)